MKRWQFVNLAIAATAGFAVLVWSLQLGPTAGAAALAGVSQAETVSIAIEPASASLAVGEFVAVEVQLHAGAQQVDKVDIFVDFNPAMLQVVDASGSPATSITPGSPVNQVTQNRVDAAAGQITYSACCMTSEDLLGGGSVVVAAVRFKSIAGGSSPVAFSLTPPRTTAAYAPGTAGAPASNVLTTTANGTVTVTATADPGATGAPALMGPDDGVTVSDMAPLLRWTNPAGTTQYQVQVVPFDNDGPGINLIRNTETSYQVQAPLMGRGSYVMLPGMSYTWRVRTSQATTSVSENDPGWSVWASRTFVTAPPTSAGIRPVSPADGSTIESLTPTLVWDDTDIMHFYYEVQVSKDPAFNADPKSAVASVYWNLVHGGQTIPRNSYDIPASYPLEAASTYYWRVRPRVQGDGITAAWSHTWVIHICCSEIRPGAVPLQQCLVGNPGFESPLSPSARNWAGEDLGQGGVAGRATTPAPAHTGSWSGYLFQGTGPSGQGSRSLSQDIPSLSPDAGYALTFWIWPSYGGAQSEQTVSLMWDRSSGGVDAMVLLFQLSSTTLTGAGPSVTTGIPALNPGGWNYVEVVADADAGTYSVSVNHSTPVATTGTFGNGITATLVLGGGNAGDFYHDDFCLDQ